MPDCINDLIKSNTKKLNLLIIAGFVGAFMLKTHNDKIRDLAEKIEELTNTKGE